MFYKRLILIVVLGFLAFSSCELDYEDNQRILVTGEVRNGEGVGLANIPVEISTNNLLFRDLAGKINTDEDGVFRVVILRPKSFEDLSITFNDLLQQNANPQYRETSVRIEATDIINNDLKLTPVTLEQVAEAGK